MADTPKTEPAGAAQTHTYVEPRASLVSNTLAIVGFIIVIVIVLWGLFNIATLGTPWLSSLFGGSSDSIKVTVPTTVTSDTPFAITWKYSTSEQGTYAFLYQCKDVVRFRSADAAGAQNAIPCGAAYTLATTNNALTLTPLLSGTASTSVPLSIVFIPSATTSKQVQGSATVIVNPATTPVVTPPATSTPPAPPATTTPPVVNPPTPAGPADLSVQILSVVPDGAGGGIATFDIGNDGSSSTGVYSFTARLPMTDGRLYNSPAQASLAPGDHVVNTLRFSQAMSGIFSVVVNAGTKNEARTDNNYAAREVIMPYVPPSYPQYPQYPY